MPVIIGIIILVLGAICIAFDVSLVGALLIVFGICLFLVIVVVVLNAIKNQKSKRIVSIGVFVLIALLCVFVLTKCFAGTSSSDDGWEMCLKCDGDGKVVNDLGFNVSCPRCNGVGYLP